jgi:predicted nuclease with TOPRIM domain
MRQQLEERLNKLKSEFESGQNMLSEFDAKASSLRETLLRISGAIQVLEEALKETAEAVPENN